MLLSALLLRTGAARASTTITGGNLGNQTWTLAGSPYIVTGDATVQAGATLTIQPGVTVDFPGGDVQASGSNPNLTELIIAGTLNAVGTAANPITFESPSGGTNKWYGIDVRSTATATISYAAIYSAYDGVTGSAPGTQLALSHTSVGSCVVGVLINAGTPTLDSLTIFTTTIGIFFTGTGGGVVSNSTIIAASQAGIQAAALTSPSSVAVTGTAVFSSARGVDATAPSAGLLTVSVLSSTFNNGTFGVSAFAQSAGQQIAMTIKNSIVSQYTQSAVSLNLSGGGTGTLTTTYSDVWNNGVDFYSSSAGVGCISSNPIYVDPFGNLRLTSNSPARFAGETGLDIGALPYISDPTPGLYGTLWTNATLAIAGSPYTMVGDLTVPPGVTLTIDPGVTINVSSSSDFMRSGVDPLESELRIAGTLTAVGLPGQPITMNSPGTPVNAWQGIILLPGATGSSLTQMVIDKAITGVDLQATAASNVLKKSSISNGTTGVRVSVGSPVLDGLTIAGVGTGVAFVAPAAGTVVNTVVSGATTAGISTLGGTASSTVAITNTVVKAGAGQGVYAVGPSAGTLTMTVLNSTIHASGSHGVQAHAPTAGTQATLTIKNSIISQNTTNGVFRNGTGAGTTTVTVTYSDVWGNAPNYSPLVGPGAGCISQNPNYVNPPASVALQSSSVCIDVGTAVGAPATDLLGVARPLDGDGFNGPQFDMGAYEFAPVVVCGDGLVGAGEACDSGGQNGTYGSCKADCSGLGPRCGDGILNGPETCDDANNINTDACLNTCVLAKCGDGVLQAGVEMCDDGNQINTDFCLNTCAHAACGDGFVQAGVEMCDDGNNVNTDACLNTCVPAKCGDGVVQAGVEGCDDGNFVNFDACLNTCVIATCGDGVVHQGVESCDDGNQINTDLCLNTCQLPKCGDGIVGTGFEQCDDGNMVNTDACLNTCKNAKCGDGVVQQGVEGCDDGNNVNNDACKNDCTPSACGDGVVSAGEECDDGNQINTDACLTTCVLAK